MKFIAALAVATTALAGQAQAIEGGSGAYLLGSRDTFAGIVPGPGTYITNNSVYLSGEGPTLSLGGVPVTKPELDVYVNKLDIAHFFEGKILGGTPGLVVTVPFGAGSVSGSFAAPAPFGGFEDNNSGFGDLTVTPVVGWHDGNFHYSASVSIFIPVGKYNTASVSLAPPSVEDVLNFGKNKWAFTPALSGTYFNPQTGLEFSGSLSITFNTKNETTDWQSAPELVFEGAILQHLKNGLAFGAAGYAYQQLGDDSGTGADNFKRALGADSLQARVFGIGPIATYNTKFGQTPVGLKLKYMHEFAAKRRFENNVVWASFNFPF